MKKILKLMLTASVIAAMQFIAACGDDSKDDNFPPPLGDGGCCSNKACRR